MANGLFGGGSGTTTAPYLVEDAADLEAVRKLLAVHYKQTANIDMLAVENHVPIGTQTSPFTGSYDGGDFEIQNIKMAGAPGYFGLFGHISSPGTVRNLHLTNATVNITTGNGSYNGGVVGYYASTQNLENVTFQGVFKHLGSGYAAGVVGGVGLAVKVVKCKFNGVFETAASNYSGGVAGYSPSAIGFYDCHTTGTVSSTGGNCGGVVGYGKAYDCSFDGEIIATNTVAGITMLTAERCQVKGTKVQSVNSSAAGICGDTAIDCVNNMAEVIGETVAVGITLLSATRCVNYSTVRGRTHAMGISYKGATDCANRGPLVTSVGESAGVNGYYDWRDSTTARCLCTANVETTGIAAAGITVGDYQSTSTSYFVESCYFLGGHVKGAGATTAKIGRITSVPRPGNKNNYSIDTSRIILE